MNGRKKAYMFRKQIILRKFTKQLTISQKLIGLKNQLETLDPLELRIGQILKR